jgi:hypothetical protein
MFAGCSDAPLHRSGDRLRAILWDAGGGATRLIGWHDRTLDEECAFAVAEDGRLRCLPPPAGGRNFLDAGCTQPAAVLRPGEPAPRHVAHPLGNDCRGLPRLRVLQPTAERVTSFHFGDPDNCSPGGAGFQVAPLVASDPSQFAGVELVTEPVDDELAAQVFVGDDGSRQVWRAWDRVRDTACGISPDAASSVEVAARCVPGNIAEESLSFFEDAQCTLRPAFYCLSNSCTAPQHVMRRTQSCAGNTWQMFELGPRATRLYGSTLCDDQGTPFGDLCPYFSIGRAVDAAAFPAARVAAPGDGSMKAPILTTSEGRAVAVHDAGCFWDSVRQARCCPRLLDDGAYYCTDPSAPGAACLFADPSCQEPLAGGTRSCSEPSHAYERQDQCSSGVTRADAPLLARRVLSPFTGTRFYQRTNMGCVELAGAPLGDAHWVIGDRITDVKAELPLLVRRVE